MTDVFFRLIHFFLFKKQLRQRQEDIYKLKDELRNLQLNQDNDLRQKELVIEGLNLDLSQKKNKV